MAYTFEGVFVERPELSTEELETVFNGYVRHIQTPFIGAVISFKDPDEVDEDELSVPYDREKEHAKVRARILDKSRSLPDSNIVYIYYDTFGGLLDFVYGFACRNGQLIENSERCTEDPGEPDGGDIFFSLQMFVGSSSTDIYFAPFERGYFPNT